MIKKIIVSKEELEKAYLELNKCPCCAYKGFEYHFCSCNPEVFKNVSTEIIISGEEVI